MANVDVVWDRPWMYPKQEHALFNDARTSVCEASVQVGKTVGAAIWALEKRLEIPDHQVVWWIGPSHGQARQAFERIERWLSESVPGEHWSVRKSPPMRLHILGKMIEFHSGKEPDWLYGTTVGAAVIDEFTICSSDLWDAVYTRLTKTEGPIRLIGNVRGRRNWGYKLARRAERGDDWTCPDCDSAFARNLHYTKITAWDAVEAGIMSEESVLDAKRSMDESSFRQLMLAEPADDAGNPFGFHHIDACGTLERPADTEAAAWGWDLGRHQNQSVGIALDAEGKVCDLRSFRRDWDETLGIILGAVGDTPALVDASRDERVFEELYRRGGNNFEGFRITNASVKQQLMEDLKFAIQHHEIAFPAESDIKDELDSFTFELTATKTLYKPMPGEPDDHVDALALAVRHWREQQRKPSRSVPGVSPLEIRRASKWRRLPT